jgi:tRNA nucleotidyltransferase (CCA-adding enzyme)
MAMNISRLPETSPADVKAIGRELREAGHAAFLVGGCVRDFLAGRGPRDWDIMTSAPAGFLERRFHRALRRGAHADSFLVFASPDSPPRDVSLLGGMSIEGDLGRRDFTINAMAVPFPPAGAGGLVDPYGGRVDLAAGVLRAVGNPDARFAEDPLRPLRGVRLEVELALTPEAATLAGMRRGGQAVAGAAPERVRDELLRTLAGRAPSRGIERMRETGMLTALLPEIAAAVDVGQNRFHTLDVYRHTLAALDFISESEEADPVLRLAVLLHDVGKPPKRTLRRGEPTFIGHESLGASMAEARARSLRLPEAEVERVRNLVLHHLIRYTDRWSDRAVRRFLRRVGPSRVEDLLRLYAADQRAKDPAHDTGATVPGEVAALSERIEAARAAGAVFGVGDLAISGGDVMEALGIPPGPAVGRALAALLDRVIADPSLNSRERLLAALREVDDPGKGKTC